MKQILLKDKIKDFENMLTDVTYLINNVKILKIIVLLRQFYLTLKNNFVYNTLYERILERKI